MDLDTLLNKNQKEAATYLDSHLRIIQGTLFFAKVTISLKTPIQAVQYICLYLVYFSLAYI